MLDQNTDRFWYVIGAVLVGAALILGANTLFPETFASMSDSFTTKADESSEVIDDIDMVVVGDSVNLLEPLGLVHDDWHTVIVPTTAVNYVSQYISLDELNMEAGDIFTVSFDYDSSDFEFKSRVMFSPIQGETNDKYEINKRSKEWYSGTGRTSHSVIVPEGSKYMLLRLDNQRHNGDKWNVPVSVRRVKLERGSLSSAY